MFLKNTSHYELIIDSQEVSKVVQRSLVYPSPSSPPGEASYRTMAQYQSQDTGISRIYGIYSNCAYFACFHLNICVNSSMQFYHMYTLCNNLYSKDTELFHHYARSFSCHPLG